MRNQNQRYPAEIIAAAHRAWHREVHADPARYVRLATVRGQRSLVQIDDNGDPFPVCWSKRAWRTVVYRTPVSREWSR